MKSIPFLIKCLINSRVNVWSKSMLNVTSSKKSCLIEVIFSIIELISFFIKYRRDVILSEEVSKAFDAASSA